MAPGEDGARWHLGCPLASFLAQSHLDEPRLLCGCRPPPDAICIHKQKSFSVRSAAVMDSSELQQEAAAAAAAINYS